MGRHLPFPYYVIENLEKIYTDYLGTNHTTEEVLKLFNTYFEMEKQGIKIDVNQIKELSETYHDEMDELVENND